MSEDRLPGWNAGAILIASLLTGVAAGLTAYALMIFDDPILFPPTLDIRFALALGLITLLGLAVGLVVITPLAMIFSALAMRLVLNKPWAAHWLAWATTGAMVGAIVLLIPFLIQINHFPWLGGIALFGAACGVTAALLRHRLLGIRRTV